MEYVFGSTLVCDTLDNAKKVAFDKQVMTKTVTLGGDIFDPQGTLSGGENIYEIVFMMYRLLLAWINWSFPHKHLKTVSQTLQIPASSLPGARSQSASVLTSLQEVKDVRDNLNEKEAQLQDTERQLAGLKGTAEKYADKHAKNTFR